MFIQTSETEALLDTEIRAVLAKLTDTEKTSDEYGKLVERLSRLHKLKTEEHATQIEDFNTTKPEPEPESWFQRVSPDTALVVTANIVGILAIINHERLHPITSKALSFVHKPR